MNPPRKRAPVTLSASEVAALAEAIRPARLKALKALVLICAWCGLRWGEVSELRRHDVSAVSAYLPWPVRSPAAIASTASTPRSRVWAARW
jgi:integrase